MGRVFAREAVHKVGYDGLRWVISAGSGTDTTPFEPARPGRVNAAQAGLVADMDRVADALYGRA